MKLTVNLLPEATAFINSLDRKTRRKVFFNIEKTQLGLSGEWFQKMPGTNELWEFRTLYNQQYIRLFAFWDKRNNQQTLIVCTHGFLKTTGKTPMAEIIRAEKLKSFYFNE